MLIDKPYLWWANKGLTQNIHEQLHPATLRFNGVIIVMKAALVRRPANYLALHAARQTGSRSSAHISKYLLQQWRSIGSCNHFVGTCESAALRRLRARLTAQMNPSQRHLRRRLLRA